MYIHNILNVVGNYVKIKFNFAVMLFMFHKLKILKFQQHILSVNLFYLILKYIKNRSIKEQLT